MILTMNKTNLVIIIGIMLTITALGYFLFNSYERQLIYEYNSTPERLNWVFANCECEKRVKSNPDTNQLCVQPLVVWQNSTHYIDNNVCKFLEIRDGFVIPIDADHCPNTMIAVDGKCKQHEYFTDPFYWIILVILIPVILIIIFV